MRVYRIDGSYIDDPDDTGFGWFFKDIIVDEAIVNYQQRNQDVRMYYFLKKSPNNDHSSDSEESVETNETIRVPVEIINPKIETEPVENYINCDAIMNNLSSICNAEEFRNIESEKYRLANSINPCSVEAKTLLSVIHNAKFKSLVKENTTEELLKNINYKSTNLKFLLSNHRGDPENIIFDEIDNYQKTQEENMLSLMTELISTNVDYDVSKLVNTRETQQLQVFPQFIVNTRDVDNTMSSNSYTRGEKYDNYRLQLPPDKSYVLNSLGLMNEEKSIQSCCEETYEMYKELTEIKTSFRELDNKLNELFRTTSILTNDIKEVLYLNDIIYLLRGEVEKVKINKLPFKIFYEHDSEPNLII